MAASLVALILLLFIAFASGGRTKLDWRAEYDDYSGGICNLMVVTQGYTCEEHRVTTKDGYILSMQRIPTGRTGGGNNSGAKPPVLLQHGLMSDAMTWLSNSPDESLGFILADNGFDVWLASVRGTTYSSGHTSLTPDDPGTLMAFGAFSRNEVSDIVRSAALLSPIAYMGQMPSPLARAAADSFIAEDLYWLGLNEFDPGGGAASKLVAEVCTKINCTDLESVITGPNCCMNASKSNLDHQQPTATKNMVHLAQMIRRGTIAMYDYDDEGENKKHYGQTSPPEYNITSIPNNLPIFLGYGGKDLLSDVNDVQTLIDTLSGHDPDKIVLQYTEEYAHLDFVYGINAKEVVYNPLIAFFNQN
ncbi:hypothetical protein ABFS83_13G010700 [Erythranthe nasuta]